MGTFIFKCPTLGVNVQGWIAEDASTYTAEEFTTIVCTACKRSHLINTRTGRGLGEGSRSSSDE